MFGTPEGSSREIVENMCNYMTKSGLEFRKIGLDDSSPYGILINGTSVGYRRRSKWNETGIVFFD